MNFDDDSNSKKLYNKYKYDVKKWEKEFTAKYSRVPSKFDIKEAPAKVRYAYKQYFNLKSSALETSVLDYELVYETAVGSPEYSLSNLEESLGEHGDVDSVPNLPSSSQIKVLLSSTNLISSETNLFDTDSKCEQKIINSTKAKSTSSSPIKTLKKTSTKLSEKLFQNSKFSVRNPRKSISSKSIISESVPEQKIQSINQETHQPLVIDEINHYVVKNEKSHQNAMSHIQPPCNFNQTILRNINQDWINRCSEDFDKTLNVNKENHQSESSDCFGMNNIIIQNQTSEMDEVENSESENEEKCSQNVIIKQAIKRRKIETIIDIKNNQNAISKVGSKNSSPSEEIKGLKNTNRKTKSLPKVKKKMTKSKTDFSGDEALDSVPTIDDYIPFGPMEPIIPRYNLDVCIDSKKGDPVSAMLEVSKNIGITTEIRTRSRATVALTDQEKLQERIRSGTLNENFVKINIEKKVFVRGKKNLNFSRFKKQEWKKKKMLNGPEFPSGGVAVCFKCNLTGHMARYCTAHRGDTLLPLSAVENDTLPTLKEIENKIIKSYPVSEEITSTNCQKEGFFSEKSSELVIPYIPSVIPDTFLQLLKEPSSNSSAEKSSDIYPLYSYKEDMKLPEEVKDALRLFGHTDFRPGQEKAILRILSGMSTLLILSTGSGKSLCYQLPAYIYSKHFKCITLVISPLVSLMEDQVISMPEFLRAGCLHNNQSKIQKEKILELLKDGELSILLISPEALIAGDRSNSFGSLFKHLPPVAFVCIDEVHCVSQWSDNFRPSYLMICRVLREKLKVKCMLGLTATATKSTVKSIIEHMDIPDGWSGVITNPTLPNNLVLTISYDNDKDRALLILLSSERFSQCDSIIVYCIRRDECDRIAGLIRSLLQEPSERSMIEIPNSRKRKRSSIIAEAYHAGMSAAHRRRIQNSFMNRELRIIVATVAFGMGINKSDIRAVIHYNVPSSFESYVQEVGRAGRDGLPAHCHAFLNRRSDDKDELLKHIHSNSIERHVVRKLIQKIFIPCKCKDIVMNPENCSTDKNLKCNGHEVAFGIDETVEKLDIPSENISTLLCYLELHEKKFIKVLNRSYVMCKIVSFGGPVALYEATKNCPPLAMAFALQMRKGIDLKKSNTIEFCVIDVAASLGWESGITKYHLKNLEWKASENTSKRSQLRVEFHTLGFRVKAPGDLQPNELDDILDYLHERVKFQEKNLLYQLEEIINTFSDVAADSIYKCCSLLENENYIKQSDKLKIIVKDYFERDNLINDDIRILSRPVNEPRAINDIRSLIVAYKDCTFTGRSIARILQGISSPNFPAIVWGRCRFWRTHMSEDFHELARIATAQILDMR